MLLGDIIELRQGSLQDALAAASRILPQLVSGLGAGREVILLVGNHDHQLQLHPEALGQVKGMLSQSGASVRFEYPGVWLRDDVYAQHGHYLDRHTTTPAFERIAAGAMARFLKLPFSRMSEENDYERLLAPIYAWMFAISQTSEREIDAADGGGSSRALALIRESRGAQWGRGPGRTAHGARDGEHHGAGPAQPRPLAARTAPLVAARLRGGVVGPAAGTALRALRSHAPRRAARRR